MTPQAHGDPRGWCKTRHGGGASCIDPEGRVRWMQVVLLRTLSKIVAPAPTGPRLKLGPLKLFALLNCPFFPIMGLAARAVGARRETVAGTS